MKRYGNAFAHIRVKKAKIMGGIRCVYEGYLESINHSSLIMS